MTARASVPGRRGPYRRKQLIDIAVKQLLMARQVQSQMTRTIEEARKDPEKPLESQFLRDFNALTKTITDLTEQIRRSRKDERQAMGGLSNEQLDEVLRIHLPRIAAGMTDADKRLVLAVWFGDEVTKVLLAPREAAASGATP